MIEDNFYKYRSIYDASPEFLKNLAGRAYAAIPLNLRYGGVYGAYYELLRHSAYWDEGKIETYILGQFNKTLKLALGTTEFYPKHYQCDNMEVKSIKEISSLPLISKRYLISQKQEFLNRSIPKKKLLYVTTGGTSGRPTATGARCAPAAG